MFIKLSLVVLLLSVVCGVFGASVAVNVTDAEMLGKNAPLLNYTTALNASENILKARQIELLKLNITEISLNLTENSTHLDSSSLLKERESGEDRLVFDTGNSSTSSNSSDLEKLSLQLNSTTANSSEADNITSRSVDGTNSSVNFTTNGTANPWSALPLFRDLNATLHNLSLLNSSDSSNSSHITRDVESPENSMETGAADEAADDLQEKVSSATDKADQLLDDSNDDGLEDGSEDDETQSTKKPCSTVSCFISRGCSDTSCSQDDN